MAKDSIRDYSATSSNNSDIQSVDISEGCAPSGLNNAIREVMTDLKNVSTGTVALETPVADSFSTDTISEKTSATGVTIDGVLLKDGAIGSIASAVAAHLTSINGGQIGGARNLIINGNMAVAQYGANNLNITSASGGTFACDRFKFYLSLGGTAQFDLQQVAEAPTGSGFSNSLKVSCDVTDTLTAGNYLFIEYNIEGQDLQRIKKGTSDAESLTLSFWLKSNKTASGQVNVRDHDNTRLISKTYTVSSADTWQYVTLTFDGDTTGVITNDNTKGLSLEFFLDSGTTYSSGATPANWEALSAADRNATSFGLVSSTDNYWQITGIQLEVGEVATPFEHESFAETLHKCQRFYQIGYVAATGRADGGTMGGAATFATPMRASATMAVVSTSGAHYAGSPSLTGAAEGVTVTSPVNGTGNNAYRQIKFSAVAEL